MRKYKFKYKFFVENLQNKFIFDTNNMSVDQKLVEKVVLYFQFVMRKLTLSHLPFHLLVHSIKDWRDCFLLNIFYCDGCFKPPKSKKVSSVLSRPPHSKSRSRELPMCNICLLPLFPSNPIKSIEDVDISGILGDTDWLRK